MPFAEDEAELPPAAAAAVAAAVVTCKRCCNMTAIAAIDVARLCFFANVTSIDSPARTLPLRAERAASAWARDETSTNAYRRPVLEPEEEELDEEEEEEL